jgi:hypothetical protein
VSGVLEYWNGGMMSSGKFPEPVECGMTLQCFGSILLP